MNGVAKRRAGREVQGRRNRLAASPLSRSFARDAVDTGKVDEIGEKLSDQALRDWIVQAGT